MVMMEDKEWNKSIANLYMNKALLKKTSDCRIEVGLLLVGPREVDRC